MQQYYKNTISISIAKYRAGAMNAVGLLFDYIKVKFKPEWKITLTPKQVCTELGLSSSTFYRVLKKAQQLLGQTIYLRHEKIIPTHENEIPIPEKEIPTHENEIPTRENQKPQTPSKTNKPSDLPDLYSDLYRSLSKSEREKFDFFASQKVDELPQRPTLPKKWIARNFDELYQEWKQQSADEVQNNTSQRQFEQWYDMMRRLGHVKGHKTKDGVRLIQKVSGEWHPYEVLAGFWKLDYLKKCLGQR